MLFISSIGDRKRLRFLVLFVIRSCDSDECIQFSRVFFHCVLLIIHFLFHFFAFCESLHIFSRDFVKVIFRFEFLIGLFRNSSSRTGLARRNRVFSCLLYCACAVCIVCVVKFPRLTFRPFSVSSYYRECVSPFQTFNNAWCTQTAEAHPSNG